MAKSTNLKFSIVRVECEGKLGVGFLISENGHLLTCAHNVPNLRKVRLFLCDERGRFSLAYEGRELHFSAKPEGDICLLQLKLKTKLPDHLQPLKLYSSIDSATHKAISYGFPSTKPLQGLEGTGVIQSIEILSEQESNYSLIQLGESNSITKGFSGGPLFDLELGGVVGMISQGIIDKKNIRQLGVSFAIPIDFIRERCIEDYKFELRKSSENNVLPNNFEFLLPPKKEKIAAKKIKYQDFLQSNNLPYVSRNEFKKQNNVTTHFLTEEFIVDQLLEQENYDGGIIVGEGGIGKTRLMLEIGNLAIQKGWKVIRIKPQAQDIEELIPFLSLDNKYLFLFDYIEESKSFNSDIVANLTKRNTKCIVRVLANCRVTYKSSSNYPIESNFLQIELRQTEEEKAYAKYVTTYITGDIRAAYQVKTPDFFDIRPSFAVFLIFLFYKKQLNTQDIREVGDFKKWIEKRFCLTLKVNNFSDLIQVVKMMSILPLSEAKVDILYENGYSQTIQRLKNDGWIEEIETETESTLKVIHDTIVDELLIIHFEKNVIRDKKRELNQLLEFAIQYDATSNWLRSLERIIKYDFFEDKTVFYKVFKKRLDKSPNDLIDIKSSLCVSPVLDEDNRIKLLDIHLLFFQNYIEALKFALPLSFALNEGAKGYINGEQKPALRRIFDTWYFANKNFYTNIFYAYRIISTYIKYFGIDSFIQKHLFSYLKKEIYMKPDSYVLQAWLDQKGDLKVIQKYVQAYLRYFYYDIDAQFVLRAWLDNGGAIKEVKRSVKKYLEANATNYNSYLVFQAWLNAGGNKMFLRRFLEQHFEVNITEKGTSFIFQAWLNNQGEIDFIRRYLIEYLDLNIFSQDASYVMWSWVNNGGEIEIIKEYLLSYLIANAKDKESSIVLRTWLVGGGDIKLIEKYIQEFLVLNATHKNASYVLHSWLQNGDNLSFIKPYIQEYLEVNVTDSDAGYVLHSWLSVVGETDFIKAYLQKYLKANIKNKEVSFVLSAWFTSAGKIGDIKSYLEDYLEENVKEKGTSFIFHSWLKSGGDIELVRNYLEDYLEANAKEKEASFVFQSWLDAGGELEFVRNYLEVYLEENAKEKEAFYVLKSWMKKGGDFQKAKKYFLEFIEDNPLDIHIIHIWKKHSKDKDFFNQKIIDVLNNNITDINTFKTLMTWLTMGNEKELVKEPVKNFLISNPYGERTGELITNCFYHGYPIDYIKPQVLNFLDKSINTNSVVLVLKAWQQVIEDKNFLDPYFHRYLDKNIFSKESANLLCIWIKENRTYDFIAPYVINYLDSNKYEKEAILVIKEWVKSEMDIFLIKPYAKESLNKYKDTKYIIPLLSMWIEYYEDYDFIEDYVKQIVTTFPLDKETPILLHKWYAHVSKIDFFLDEVEEKLMLHDVKKEYRHLITGWINKGVPRPVLKPFLLKYLNTYLADEEVSYLFQDWLGKGRDFEVIKTHLLFYIKKNINNSSIGYHIGNWIKFGGDYEKIKDCTLQYLRQHFQQAEATFAIATILNGEATISSEVIYLTRGFLKKHKDLHIVYILILNIEDVERIEDIVFSFLSENIAYSATQKVLASYLNKSGAIKKMKPFVISYLEKHKAEEEAQYVLSAWLKSQGDIETVKDYTIEHLKENILAYDTQYILSLWMLNGGDYRIIEPFIKEWLNVYITKPKASYVLINWYNQTRNFELIKPYVITYIKNNRINTQILILFWLNDSRKIQDIKSSIIEHLEINLESYETQLILSTWLSNKESIEVIEPYVINWLNKYSTDYNAYYVLINWCNRKGNFDLISPYLLEWLEKNTVHDYYFIIVQAYCLTSKEAEIIDRLVFLVQRKYAKILTDIKLYDTIIDLTEMEADFLKVIKYKTNNIHWGYAISTWTALGKIQHIYSYAQAYLDCHIEDKRCFAVLDSLVNSPLEGYNIEKYIVEYIKNHFSSEYMSLLYLSLINNGYTPLIQSSLEEWMNTGRNKEFASRIKEALNNKNLTIN